VSSPTNADGPGETGPAANNSDLHEDDTPQQVIARFLRLLFSSGDVFEVRAPKCRPRPGSDFKPTISGYYTFDKIDAAAAEIAKLDSEGVAPGIYITMNPVNSALLARANCRLERGAKFATGDDDVLRRVWLLIDCDPIRPADISSTDAELAQAKARALAIRAWLKEQGWPEPIIVLSGNGYHLLFRIDLPSDDEGLVKKVLEALAARFDDEHVKIDRSVFNASRITKVAGTMARKGDDLRGISGVEDRPHRRSAIVSVPEPVALVAREQLEGVIPPDDGGRTQRSAPNQPPLAPSPGAFERFDHTPAGVRGYLERRGVTVTGEKTNGDATYLLLKACPVVRECDAVNGSDIAVIVSSSGLIAYKNLHNRGTGLGWVDVREALEPGYKAHSEAARRPPMSTEATATPPTDEGVSTSPWLIPLPLIEPACDFPLQDAFPPGLEQVRDYAVAIAEAFQVPVDMPALLILPAAGLGLSHVVEVRLAPEWRQPPNHYVAVLMESANRKTGPYREITGPIYEWERRRAEVMAPELAAQKARLDVLRRKAERFKDLASGKVAPRRQSDEPTGKVAEDSAIQLEQQLAAESVLSPPQLITGDTTTEELARLLGANGERIGVFSDESEAIEVFLGRYNQQPNLQLYNKAYDGSPHRVNRVVRAPLLLDAPLISIGFAIQPEGVRDLLADRKAKGTGLIARFGMAMPVSLLGRRSINAPAVPAALRASWQAAIQTILDIKADATGTKEVALDADAKKMFQAFRAGVEPQLSWCGEFAAFGMQDWGGKLCGRIGRIALVLHGLRYAVGAQRSLTDPIAKETMLAAIAWAPYLIDHAKAVMGWAGADERVVGARRVLAWLARANLGRFTKQECFTAVRNAQILIAQDVNDPLDLLVELGYVRPLPCETATGPGRRKSPEFLVNPKWDRRSP
jgi:Protein of unknown function (DUF3987)